MPHELGDEEGTSKRDAGGDVRSGEPSLRCVAKIAVIGDGGVGKSDLARHIAGATFERLTVLPDLSPAPDDGTRREVVIWDFPGNPDHRLINTLFLDDVDLAVVAFDPAVKNEPLKSVEYWLRQLPGRQAGRCRTIIVAARVDRGSMVTQEALDAFCKDNGISGSHISASTTSKVGLAELLDRVRGQIPWDEIAPQRAETFERVRGQVSLLKETDGRSRVLVSPDELLTRVAGEHAGEGFEHGELMGAVRVVAVYGDVVLLRGLRESPDTEMILLDPDLLTGLASDFIAEARRTSLGTLDEGRVLRGEYAFPTVAHLDREEQKILLDAMTVLFIEHNVCFRQPFDGRTLLVFPSLISLRRPNNLGFEESEDISYLVTGDLENVYPAVVVQLGYTNSFTHKDQWEKQAQYEVGSGEVCGFRQAEEREGECQFVLYYKKGVAEHTKLIFQGHFQKFLGECNVAVIPFPPLFCHKCGYQQSRTEVVKRRRAGKKGMFCSDCGEQWIDFPTLNADTPLTGSDKAELEREQALVRRRRRFEAETLTALKSLIVESSREGPAPTCFVCYARGVPEHERWVEQFVNDLSKAEVDVIYDKWDNPCGSSNTEFTERITTCDCVAVVCTPELREKVESTTEDRIVAAEIKLVGARVMKPVSERGTVLPILLAGSKKESFPPILEDLGHQDFTTEADYFSNLLDIILRIHKIPFKSSGVADLRSSVLRGD